MYHHSISKCRSVLVLKALVIIIFGLLMMLSESRTAQHTLFGNYVFHGSKWKQLYAL